MIIGYGSYYLVEAYCTRCDTTTWDQAQTPDPEDPRELINFEHNIQKGHPLVGTLVFHDVGEMIREEQLPDFVTGLWSGHPEFDLFTAQRPPEQEEAEE